MIVALLSHKARHEIKDSMFGSTRFGTAGMLLHKLEKVRNDEQHLQHVSARHAASHMSAHSLEHICSKLYIRSGIHAMAGIHKMPYIIPSLVPSSNRELLQLHAQFCHRHLRPTGVDGA